MRAGPPVNGYAAHERRVLLVSPQPFYAPRGTPMNVRQMCRVLGAAGYRVDLACYPLGEDVDIDGVAIHRGLGIPGVDAVPIGFSLRKLALDALLALTVLRLLATRRYAALHAIEESVFFALPAAWLGIPLIYDLDSLLSEQLRYSGAIRSAWILAGVRWLERLALSNASAAITVCRALSDAARELCPAVRIFQIEDTPLEEASRAPDPARVAELRARLELGERPAVVYTGNLERYQGIDLLLDAAEQLRELAPEARLVLVGGEAPQVAALRAELDRRALAQSVIVVGVRPPEEMAEWMALGCVLVSPRCQGENTPLKIYTYMRAGIPIVATELPTHTQVLDAETALLCTPDAKELARAMASVIAAPGVFRARALRARERAEREYSREAFERKLLAAYDAALGS
jgi:glycosyltransferase involved in cell wall biosynthesis